MYVHMVSHLPTSFASDVISVTSILYVFKFLADLVYWLSYVLHRAPFYVGTVTVDDSYCCGIDLTVHNVM